MAAQTTQKTATATATPPTSAPAARSGPAVHSTVASQIPQSLLDKTLLEELGDFDEEVPREIRKGATGKGRQAAEPEDDDLEAEEPESEEEVAEDPELEDHEDAEEEDAEAEDEESEAEEEPEAQAEAEEGEPSKGLEKLPAWAQKRISKQSAFNSELKRTLAQRPSFIADALLPLAHCVSAESLEAELDSARHTQQLLAKLGDADYEEGEDGKKTWTYRANGETHRFTPGQVQAALAQAGAKLDSKAILAQQKFISSREQAKPWEQAEAIAPGLLQPGTEAHKLYEGLVTTCPEFKAKFGNHEVIIAHAVRDLQREQEQAPIKDFPKGKYKWVRHELDKAGNIVIPKRPGAGKQPAAAAAERPRTPVNTRPAASAAAGGKTRTGSVAKAVDRVARVRNDDSLRELMTAELGGDW